MLKIAQLGVKIETFLTPALKILVFLRHHDGINTILGSYIDAFAHAYAAFAYAA